MKYVIDDEEREVTIITMGKNDTVDDLIAEFEGREEYKVIVMDNPYLEGEYNDIPDEYSNDDEHSRIKEIADSDVEEHKEYTKQMWEAGIDDRTMKKTCDCKSAKEIIDEWENEKWGYYYEEMDDRTDDPIGLFEEEAQKLRKSIAHRWDMSDWKSKEGEKGNVDTRGCA